MLKRLFPCNYPILLWSEKWAFYASIVMGNQYPNSEISRHIGLFMLQKVHNMDVSQFTLAWPCADPENFVRGGPTLTCFFGVFLVDKIPLKVGHHWPLKWCFAGCLLVAQHWMPARFFKIRNSTYIFVIYQRGSGPPAPPPPSGSVYDDNVIPVGIPWFVHLYMR